MTRLGGLALALGVCLVAGAAHAQSPPPILIELDVATTAQIDGEALAVALANELGTPVMLATPETPRSSESPCLRLHALGPRRMRLVLVRPDGSTMRRTSSVHADAAERLATLVILASNLLRDESGELLAMLRRRAPTPDETEEPEPVVTPEPVVAPEPEPQEPAESAPLSTEPAAGEEPIATTPAPLPPTPADAVGADPPAPSTPRDPFLRLGVSGQVGTVPHAGGSFDVAWLAGVDAMITPLPFFAVGVRALGGGYTTTRAWCVGAAPFVELAWRFADVLDLHGGAGVHLQYIARDDTYETAGVAPLVVAGARLYLDPAVSLSLETALHFVTSTVFHVGSDLLPQGAVSWTGGLALAFHVS